MSMKQAATEAVSRGWPLMARLTIGSVLVWAGIAKAADPQAQQSVTTWVRALVDLEANVLVQGLQILIRVEIGLGICAILGLHARLVLVLAGALVATFTFAWILHLIFGRESVPCSCFGARSPGSDSPVLTLTRNVALVAVAFLAARRKYHLLSLDSLLAR